MKQHGGNHGKYKKKHLNEFQERFIDNNYLTMSKREMASQLDTTAHYIQEYLRNNNLIKPTHDANHSCIVSIEKKGGFFNEMGSIDWLTG